MATNSFLKMLFGQGTEPSYAGLRIPRQRMEDDARMIRLGNPQERFRQYHSSDTARPASDVLGLAPLSDEQKTEIQGGFMEAPNTRKENNAKRDSQLKGAVTGVGSMLAQAFADALIHAFEHREQLPIMGHNARELAVSEYSRETLAARFVVWLEGVA